MANLDRHLARHLGHLFCDLLVDWGGSSRNLDETQATPRFCSPIVRFCIQLRKPVKNRKSKPVKKSCTCERTRPLIPGQDRAHLDQIWSAQTEPAIDLGQLDALHAFSNFLGPDLNAGPSQSSRKNPAGTRTRDRARARSRGRPSLRPRPRGGRAGRARVPRSRT